MRRRTPLAFFAGLAVLLAAVVHPTVAYATLVEALDMRALVRESDHVFLGTVIRTESSYDHLDRIVTDAYLRVDEPMHGGAANGSTLVVRRLGGVIGDVGLRVEGEATFEPGERVVVFARSTSEGVLRPVGMSQGVLPIRTVSGAEMVMPGGEGLSLTQRGSDGRLRAAPGALAQPASLDELLAQIRDLVAEIHGAR